MNDDKHDRDTGRSETARGIPGQDADGKGRIGKAGIAGLEEGADSPRVCHRRGKAEGDERVKVANWGPYGVIFILRTSPLSPLCTHPGGGTAFVQDIPLS